MTAEELLYSIDAIEDAKFDAVAAGAFADAARELPLDPEGVLRPREAAGHRLVRLGRRRAELDVGLPGVYQLDAPDH